MASGFSFGQTAKTGTGSLFGNLAAPTTGGLGGTTGFGATAAATPSLFGATATPAAPSLFGAATTTAAAAPSLFGTPAAGTSSLFGTTATTAAASSLFGATAPAAPSLFGTTTTTAAPGLFGTTTTTVASTGLSFGNKTGTTSLFGSTATTTASSLFGSTLGAAAKPNPLALGTATVASGGGIFGNTAATATTGLGGVDPKASGLTATRQSLQPLRVCLNCVATSTAAHIFVLKYHRSLDHGHIREGAVNNNGKTSDVKIVKATPLDGIIVQSVDAFKKYVKDEKAVREDITRMSSKDLIKVQEDIVSLRQLLAILSSGVHRNASAVEKLKWDTTQDLKNAEMSHRTKDTPPGLQYEHIAPTLYFQRLIESFDSQMQTYRKQIEVMDSHLTSLRHNAMSPQELVMLLRKLHETFIALAAQLHQVHEGVKTAKDQYLNYRRVFHGDTKNIFEKAKVVPPQIAMPARRVELEGPSPFGGITSATAAAMASALTRSQQPVGAPPAVGLAQPSTLGTSSLFGTSATGGTGLFGAQPSAFGGTSSLFGNTSQSLLGNTNNSSSIGFGSSLNATQPIFGVDVNKQPFQLQKPPQGAKRGKR